MSAGLYDPDGLGLERVSGWIAEHRFLRGCTAGEPRARETILETPCDILVPAALERQITVENAHRLDCAIVFEAANGPATPEADRVFEQRGIEVVPTSTDVPEGADCQGRQGPGGVAERSERQSACASATSSGRRTRCRIFAG